MSRMKDAHIDLMNLEAEWIGFLRRLFEREGFQVTVRDVLDGMQPQPDLALSRDEVEAIVELKLHRSNRVPLTLARNAFIDVGRMIAYHHAARGILIIPQRLVESHYLSVRESAGVPIELWGLDQLLEKVAPHPDLGGDLANLLRALRVGAERPPEGPPELAELRNTAEDLPPANAGTKIADQLDALPPGKLDGADKAFETLCGQALELLFGNNLLGWRSQSGIDNGFQRVDVIARLQPDESAFWSTLVADFRTRYVVFEFKNYTDPITQDQIYTTERYLFTAALRSVAVVIARNGMAKSATRAIHGALREQGKLILCLSGDEFGAMLRGFDVGNNPEEQLIRRRDDILMSIGR
jgi:hypothetical protein